MRCPKCWNMETRVLDSRVIDEWASIRRRRECELCKNRFTTFEKIWITDLVVIKRDWTKEMYERAKIKRALMLAFAKRDISMDKVDDIIWNLEAKWCWMWKEISSTQIWDDILDALKEIDIIAYIRFASVYKKFDNLDDFEAIVSKGKK